MSNNGSQITLERIREDLSPYQDLWVIIFGSWVNNEMTNRSDIDVSIISKNHNKIENIDFYSNLIGKVDPLYDVKLFELLPLYIQGDILEHYQVVFGDEVEISYYLYRFRKLWQDNLVKINKYS